MTNAPQETYAVEKEYGAKQAARNHESHATPKGYRSNPDNRIERHNVEAGKVGQRGKPDFEPYTETASLSRKVGVPVGSEGAPSSLKSEDVKEAALEDPHTFDTVVEGRLGGGEETIYSPADGPPIDVQAPKPRSS